MSTYAIVGMSCLYPNARTPAEFWRNLRSGTDSRREGGEEVFGTAPQDRDLDPEHRIYCRRGGFVTDFTFDPTGYLVAPEQLAGLDRIYHWTLYAAREALRDSGHLERPETLRRTGLVLGNYSFPTPGSADISVPLAHEAVLEGLRRAGLPALDGLPTGAPLVAPEALRPENLLVSGAPAAVSCAALGLGGPRYALDAACSSALYALKLACGHLATGEADLVLAGGVCAPDPTLIHLSFSDLRAYPPTGFSQPFDDRSEGILTGQGAGMVAVRRLADARRDGDRILAVVDGIGWGNDGSGRHLLVPQGAGQLRSYELAYAEAGIEPSAIDYLECHATGTPLGDSVEAESVAAFFGGHGRVPLIGSVKGNIGHLLSVAGLSSLLKVVLAMGEGHIPPTIGVRQPVTSSDGTVGDAVLVRQGRDWPAGDGPRRAAVSAFGFGGTNAHVVLSEPPSAERPGAEHTAAEHTAAEPAARPGAAGPGAEDEPLPALDLVGLGAHFGGFTDLAAFERALHDGTDCFGPLPPRRWRGLEQTAGGSLARAGIVADPPPHGAFVDGVEVDPIDHKVPPADLRTYNPQHALAITVADEALRDAGYSRAVPAGATAPPARRIGVVVAMELEPYTHARLTRYGLGAFLRAELERAGVEVTEEQRAALAAAGRDAVVEPIVANEVLSYIGNVMASRISSLWNLTGPSFTLSAEGGGTAEALRAARLLLLDPGIEAVLVGAVDLAGSAEHLLLRGGAEPGTGLSFADDGGGWRVGEGAGAVVVRRAGERPGRVYARLDALAVRHSSRLPAAGALPEADPDALAEAAGAALAAAGIGAADVGYLEAHAGGTDAERHAELAALARVYPAGAGDGVALGSAKAQIGDAGCAAGIAAVIRAALCLHHGYLPGTGGWQRPAAAFAAAFADSALYVPDRSRPWLRPSNRVRRHAAVNLIGAAGAHGHLVLSGGETSGRYTAADWRRADGPVLLPIGAGTLDGLLTAIASYRGRLDGGADPLGLAREAADALPGSTLRAVLVGRDTTDLRLQLELAARDIPGAHAAGGEWATPAGSYFTARPVGPDARVALVYPGAFNSYPGLGQDLFRAFPGLLDRFEAMADEPDRQLRAALLYPRAQVTPGRRELMTLEGRLADDVPFMLATGTSFAILYTALVRDILGVPAHGGFGYSLGESSMLFATGGWRAEGRRDDLISGTPIFRDRLTGPRRTVRELWDVPEETADKDLWSSHVLLTGENQVRDALTRYDRVFLTHVNTPGELVVAGDPAQCRALIAELGCPAARSPVGVVMHCPVVDAEVDGLAGLNDHPTGSLDGLELFSAYDYQPLPGLDRQRIARRIAHTLRSTIDFPRLVRAAYERGYRYFIEVGPGATCSRWVRETLGDAPHVAVCVDRRGVPATKGIAHLAARLVGNGLPVDLTALLGTPAPAAGAAQATADASAAGRTARARSGAAGSAGRFAVGGGDPIPERIARDLPAHFTAVELLPEPRPVTASVSRSGAAGASDPFDAPEDPALMPADPTVADAEAIVFDGDPISFLPWAPSPAAPAAAPPAAGPPTGAPPVPAVRAAAPTAPATAPATAPEPALQAPASPGAPAARSVPPGRQVAADLVRELRQQMIATHSVVMETQRILQSATLSRTEALLDPERPAPPATYSAAPTGAPAAAAVPPAPAAPPALPAAPPAAVPPALPPAAVPPPAVSASAVQPAAAGADGVIWDEADLLEFATGSVAEVFGPRFAEIDGYAKRVRLPAPPYHFVTRVTALKATTGVFEPATITTEYDIPLDAWYAVDGGVPPAVTVEAGQCDLLLVSYLGIDFRNRGERVYRLLDSSLIFHGPLPHTGQTLRYDISIDRFVHQGETTIFFFSYHCYADGELILELRDACAGFFSRQELDSPLGVVITDRERAERAALTRASFKPLAYTAKTVLTAEDLALLAEGRPGDVFGPEHAQDPGLNPALRLPDERLRMVDEVTIDRTGGPRGLGTLSAVKRLDPDGWYFTCHFPDDPVLAGSLVAEGAVQLLQIELLYLGMHLTLPDARFQTVTGRRIDVQVRGQVTPEHREIRYEVEIMEITLLPRPTVIADILVHLGDKPVIRMRNLGLQVLEKPGTPYRPETGGVPAFLGRRNRSGEPAMINELHLAHAAKGLLDMAMGPEFEVYRDSRAPYIPNGDFQFVDRVMSLKGRRGELAPGSEMVTEYDSPADAWYYRHNAHPHMPNCVYMETSLQAAIFLGYYLGATLKEPGEQYAIRNLDGRATVVKDIDLRGKTIRHHSKLLMTSAVSGAVLQNFSYELSADGEVFYTGESLFGYFSAAALANQVGLDNGRYLAPWIEQEQPAAERVRRIELPADAPAFTDPDGGHLRLPGGHFHLVDHLDLVADGGRYGAGYLHGYRRVRDDEWYFDCHFHRDPVMPGSLGVEAVLQAMRLFVLEQGLADGFERPRFSLGTGVETTWKYRGQILRGDGELRFDTHIKEVRREADRLLVVADADLWKPGLRIYELADLSIEVRSADPDPATTEAADPS